VTHKTGGLQSGEEPTGKKGKGEKRWNTAGMGVSPLGLYGTAASEREERDLKAAILELR